MVCLEGVLCKGFPPNGAPVWDGLKLYHALATQYKVVLDSGHDDYTDIEHWCQVNGLARHVLVMARDATEEALEGPVLASRHLDEWRGQGFDVSLYVTADPAVAATMLARGVTTLLLTHPAYARPEFRPDHDRGLRSWEQIEAEVTEAAAKRPPTVRVDAEMQEAP